jgi:hypothetical protein
VSSALLAAADVCAPSARLGSAAGGAAAAGARVAAEIVAGVARRLS